MFVCELCDYKTHIKGNYTKHLQTNKHLLKTTKQCENCDKIYKTRQSLWKHKKQCIRPVVQQTIIQNIQTIQTFNLNIFLNETCKDALNITEFVNSLNIEECDIEETGRIGFVNGISKIFIRGLEDLDLHMRPIHCSDIKREIIYIKDQDLWEKETNEYKKLKRAINTLTVKNTNKILDWQNHNPLCMEPSNKKNDQYLNIIYNNLGEPEEEYKIIKKLAKKTVIQKL